MPHPSAHDGEVLVIGAGFTGAITAILLHRAGVPVRLFDATAAYPNAFRAEKLEADQSRLLAACGLLDVVVTPGSRIRKVESLRGSVWRTREHDGHHGIRYGDTVNRLRGEATARVGLDQRRVVGVDGDERCCRVRLADGRVVVGRLAVLASGSATLLRRAGVDSTTATMTSLTFGFDAVPAGGNPAPACNHHSPAPHRDGVHYATVFPIDDAVRVNLFTAWGPDEPRVAEVVGDPISALGRLCPRLYERCPPLAAASRVQVARTDYHRVASAPPGLVVLGEAYQSVAPATGMGLGKCLTDALVLARHLPGWLRAGRVDSASIRSFYSDPEKARVDDTARDAWRWFHDSVHGRSLRSLLRRAASSTFAFLGSKRRGAGC